MAVPARRPTVPGASDLLGVPFLPPARVTEATNRLRAGIGRLSDGMAPPPVRILEGLFGMLDHQVLVALCEAGVPDALRSPMRPTDLAAAVGADPAQLERLLRFAAARRWVRIDRRGRVRPTRVTAFLRREHAGGWRAWVDFAGGGEVRAAVAELSALTPAKDAFASANGAPFFEWMAGHPDRWATFDRAMAAGGRMHGLVLSVAFAWTDGQRVCDVGGGTGALVAALLDLVPGIEGAVFDLPAVIDRAVRHERLTAMAGDAFVSVPEAFDTYLLVNVLHDWNDTDALQILGCVARAMPQGARAIVVDGERRTVPRDDLTASTDILMAALTNGGQERDAKAFAALGRACGLRLVRSVRLASGDLAHEFQTSR